MYLFSVPDGFFLSELIAPSEAESDSFASYLGATSDLNADGAGEIAVSAHNGDDPKLPIGGGFVFLYSSGDNELLRRIDSPFGGSFGAGGAVEIGDVNADGWPELVIGARTAPEGGRAYVIEARTGAVVHDLAAPSTSHFGDVVAAAGDMTGDGVPDVLVVASREVIDPDSPFGATYLFSGADGSMVRRMPGVTGEVASIADVNGDGVRDVVAGMRHHTAPGFPVGAGLVLFISGATGEVIRTIVSSPAESRDFGVDVAVIADTDADGIEDIVVGDMNARVPGRPNGAGAVYVCSGAAGSVLRRIVSPRLILNGHFGAAVTTVPDSNGDGKPEIGVGAPTEFSSGNPRQAYVFLSCAADFDGSGEVSSDDFFRFLDRYFSDSSTADVNADGRIDSQDFFDFLTAFLTGC